MGGGGTVSFNATTGFLAWGEDLEIYSPESGFLFTIAAGSVVLQDGQLLHVNLVRSPTTGSVLTASVSSQVPQSNDAYVIAIRRGSDVYFRFGSKIGNGESFNIFQGGGGGGGVGSDTYERSATFSIPDLSSTSQDATLGRTSYGGSIIGLSLELTEPVIAGTVTVTVRRDGFDTLVAVLDTSSPTSVQVIAVAGEWPVSSNSAMTILVEPDAYDNASGDPGGLTVNVTFTTGLTLEPTEIVDASDTIKGVAKLSVAPVTANDPIAVGDNDPRLNGSPATFERSASFGVDTGVSTQEATTGRVTYSGSLVGLSVHAEEATVAGTMTVNVKINGTTKLTAVLDSVTNPEFNFDTATIDTHALVQGDAILVEVVGDASYDNATSSVIGVVANVTMTATGIV
jgi:hypothetical protein